MKEKIDAFWLMPEHNMYLFKLDDEFENHYRIEILVDDDSHCLMACEYSNESLIKSREVLTQIMNNLYLGKL